ncbi:MAG: zf-HC2 domain-containing protein [Thermaerobacter sp.]|nr:zf-HC2 domain-containing protein [Thermaerobacter sp.]
MARHVTGLEISRYADGELAPELAERLEAHLTACASCRAQLHSALLLGEDLRTHFAAAAPDVSLGRARSIQRPVRYAAAAAAAVFLGIATFPRLTSDVQVPVGQPASVTAFAIGVQVGTMHKLPTLITVHGYVVERGKRGLTVRNGGGRTRVDLPAGFSTAQYPVGSAVVVHGVRQADGSIVAASIQTIQP